MIHPKIDRRNKQDLIEQMKTIAPYYTPEWRFNPSDPDLGSTLFLIFADMFLKNITRFNQVPLKHFIAFLNLFEVSLKTPQPASTFTTFYLSAGTKQEVLVPRGTQIAALHGESEVIFETENHLLVTPACITDAYKVSAKPDAIIEVHSTLFANQTVENEQLSTSCEMFNVYEGENLQEHCLYLHHEDMLNLSSPVKIELKISHPLKRYKEYELAEALADHTYVEWMYFEGGHWRPFDFIEANGNRVILHKNHEALFETTMIHSIDGKWIKCMLRENKSIEKSDLYAQIELGTLHVKTDYYDIENTRGCLPDLLFNENGHIQVDDQTGFYPFGEQFGLYGTFYISSQEAFSKKGSQITVHLTLSAHSIEFQQAPKQEIDWKLIMKESKLKKAEPQNISITKVAWEYWNGQTWVTLPVDREYQGLFDGLTEDSIKMSIHFDCPFDIRETFVQAQENYWIRVRVLSIDNIYATELMYLSPWIESIRLSYQSKDNFQLIEQCVTKNNLEFENQLNAMNADGVVFKPFSIMHRSAPAFYIGFDRPPKNGPISIFFNFHDFNFTELDKPFIEWQYLRANGREKDWSALKVLDQTNSFTKSGECRFSSPSDFAEASLFSKKRYWIRLLNRNIHLTDPFVKSPSLKGIHLNTTKVIQQQQISNENPVVMTENLNKSFQLMNYPVLSEEVWVDESAYISEAEIDLFNHNQPERIKVIRDSEQNVQRCWILWERVENFLDSKENDRHYLIHASEGKIMFGDGKFGKKPPNQESDDILVNYKIGGGTIGNINRYEMTSLQSAIPFIQSVVNHEPAGGGSNLEKLEDALLRGPKLIQHRNRAVTTHDFEALVREASQNVSKVKCLSNINSNLEKEVGCITIVILPESGVEGLQVFPELKDKIEKHLLACSANTIAFPEKIQVIKPAFLEISLNVTLVVENIDMIVETELEAMQKINQFLDPLTGNENGKGWDIGQQFHISVFYSFLKSIRHVHFVEKLYMNVCKVEHGIRTEFSMNDASMPLHGIVINGKHQVQVRVL